MRRISDVLLSDPSHWRERAKQLRADAGATPDGEERRLLLELAEMHDKFAADIEGRNFQAETPPAAASDGPGERKQE
jgi:hypothetical protein